MSSIAEYIITIKGRSMHEVYPDWGKYEGKGFVLKSMTTKRLWPKFWIKEHTVILTKHILVDIVDDGEGANEILFEVKKILK